MTAATNSAGQDKMDWTHQQARASQSLCEQRILIGHAPRPSWPSKRPPSSNPAPMMGLRRRPTPNTHQPPTTRATACSSIKRHAATSRPFVFHTVGTEASAWPVEGWPGRRGGGQHQQPGLSAHRPAQLPSPSSLLASGHCDHCSVLNVLLSRALCQAPRAWKTGRELVR